MTVEDPPVRAPNLEIEEAGDGFIVYDESRDRVHYLNHTAALVLELATGQLDAQGIASWIARVYSLGSTPVEDVERVIDELRGEHLLLAATGVDTPETEEREPVAAQD